ncbi:MAG: ATP-binding protein [Acidimicrobiales bacterium]
MSAGAALLQFAAEFVLFLAAAAGFGSVLLQTGLRDEEARPRLALVVGFAALAISAILRGSDLAGQSETPALLVLRGGGALVVFLGSWRWAAGRSARLVLWLALLVIAGAGVADLTEQPTATGLALAVGGIGLGVSVALGSRNSIAARVATNAAGVLLIVVLVLGVALSAVLLDTVQDGAVDRLQRRAGNEAGKVQEQPTVLAGAAKVVAASLGSPVLRATIERLAARTTASNELSGSLAALSANVLDDVALAYVGRTGSVQGAVNLASAAVVELTGSAAVREALDSGKLRGAVDVVDGRALAVRVEPVPQDGNGPPLGVAIATSPLDRTYLARAGRDDNDLSLALVSRDRVLASFRTTPRLARIGTLVATALDERRSVSAVVDDRFVSVAPVARSDRRAVLALVASTPTSLIASTRDDLFRYLFLIALSATLLALLLASVVGSRIGERVRRLIGAARSVQEGNLAARTGMGGDDELGVLGTTFDAMATSLEDKTAVESALLSQRAAVLAGISEALVAVDGQGRVTEFNAAAAELVGVTVAEAEGRPLDEVVDLEEEDGRRLDVRLGTASSRWSGQGFVKRRDGTREPVAISVGTLATSGLGGRGRVVVLRSLGPERDLEKMKTEFLARVGHEFRTPLTTIIPTAGQLNAGQVPAELVQERGKEILTQSRIILRLVEMQEFFVSAAGGQVDLLARPVEPRAVIDDAVKRWRARLDYTRQIARRVAASLPTLVADRDLLVRCLEELIDNADKWSPDGGRIVVAATRAEGGALALSVQDRGIGMSPVELANAFELFAQTDASDIRERGGMGLGLTFVQRVVTAHGGRLDCESAPGSGTKVSMIIPLLPREEQR